MDEPFRALVSRMKDDVGEDGGSDDDDGGKITGGRQRTFAQHIMQPASELNQILSGLKEAVILVSKDGLLHLANPPAVRLLGLDPVGMPVQEVVKKLKLTTTNGTPVKYDDLPIQYALDGQTISGECFSFIDRNNTSRFFSVSSYPLILDRQIAGAVIVINDETASSSPMECASTHVERERHALKAIFDSAPEAIVVVDEHCSVIMSNPKARWLYDRCDTAEPEPRYSEDPPNDIIAHPLGRTVFKGEVIDDFEMEWAQSMGSVKHILVNTSPIRDPEGMITGGVGIFHDITERKREKLELQRIRQDLEKRVDIRTRELMQTVNTLKSEIEERRRIENKLRKSEAQLKQISKKMLDTLEADRKTIAKELHDSIGANLAAIKFSLEEKLAKMTATPPDDLISLENIVSYLMDTIKETKRISANLRPTTMDDLGLSATISWFCREFKTFYRNVEVHPHIDIRENEISESMKIVIYRILQEAMSNAAKHARPGRIDLDLKKENGRIILRISDDGLGFDQDTRLSSPDPLSGHGIAGMKERAEICGGTFTIVSSPGNGTNVEVSIPLQSYNC